MVTRARHPRPLPQEELSGFFPGDSSSETEATNAADFALGAFLAV